MVAQISNNTMKKYEEANRQSLVKSQFMASSQEAEWVYSYNPGAHTGSPTHEFKSVILVTKAIHVESPKPLKPGHAQTNSAA